MKADVPEIQLLTHRDEVLCRVLKVTRLKAVNFLFCRVDERVVQCVVEAFKGVCPPVGSIVRLKGRWQKYGGRREDLYSHELLVHHLDVLATPTSNAWRLWEQPQRRRAVRLRSVAIRAAEQCFWRAGFIRVETPIIMGPEAQAGTTHPFRVDTPSQRGFLAVSNIVNQTRWQAAGFDQVYQISRLCWAHQFKNRFSLSEFALIEYSIRGASPQDLIRFTEDLLEEVRTAILSDWRGKEPPQTLACSLRNLPVLKYQEVVQRAEDAGVLLSSQGHVLPQAVDGTICAQLGSQGFWCTNSPLAMAPFYARCEETADGYLARSVELRLRTVPDAGSGSEWNTDWRDAERRLESWSNPAAGRSYIELLRNGLPPTVGFSLGIDRLLMFLLDLPRITDLVVEPRRQRSFAAAPTVAPAALPLVEPDARQGIPDVNEMRDAWDAVRAAVNLLEQQGFLPTVTSLLSSEGAPPELAAPMVDWFGRSVPLVGVQQRRHHHVMAEGPQRLLEIGPGFPGRDEWWHPSWRLQASWVTVDFADVWARAAAILHKLVGTWKAAPSELIQLIASLPPTPAPHSSSGMPLLSIDLDVGRTFRWRWGSRTLVEGGLWPSEGAGGMGGAPSDGFGKNAPMPGGGFTAHLTDGLGLPWGVELR